jgi:hypothetical protein
VRMCIRHVLWAVCTFEQIEWRMPPMLLHSAFSGTADVILPSARLLIAACLTVQVVRSGEFPGMKIDQALRAIALEIAQGNIRYDMTCEELLDHVLREGRSVDFWATSMPKHELIC